jgi:signal transduction histidine kinase
LGDALALVGSTLEEIRLLAHNLRPPALDAVGIDLTLEDYCRDFGRRTKLQVAYSGCDCPVPTSDDINICLYRFLQEALTNVAKHAGARRVEVDFANNNRQVSLSVTDDGAGFDVVAVLGSSGDKGIGITGMRERLKMLGGELLISSGPGEGTSLTAIVFREDDL